MRTLPPAMVANLSADSRRGCCCLIECDKGWAPRIYAATKERLAAAGVRCGYLDGRVKDQVNADSEVIVAAVAQMRWAARAEEAVGTVFALPHLDIMTAVEGGWTTISREVIPLLYENPESVWLGFCDPSLRLPNVVQKVFGRRYVFDAPFRVREAIRHTRSRAEVVACDDAWASD